jgi:hypothetical protein
MQRSKEVKWTSAKEETMLRLLSQWDLCEESIVFSSEARAIAWLHDNLEVVQMAAEEDCSVEDFVIECFDDGYFSFQTLTYIS